MQTLTICKLGFNQNYCTFTLILLTMIVLCSTFIWTNSVNYKCFEMKSHELARRRFMMAPMVDQSELAFRQLGRKYGCDLCYTPMLHSRIFSTTPKYEPST